MMLAKSLQSAAGNAAGDANYIEDVFSTYLYTGNGSTQTINNGIDLAGEGGLVWVKSRSVGSGAHYWVDTVRGATKTINSDNTAAEFTAATGVTAFSSSGFSIGSNGNINASGSTNASWTFRKQEKFFDCVTYTGDGVANRQIAHNIGGTVGFILIKRYDSTGNWLAWHRSVNPGYGILDLTEPFTPGANGFVNAVTDTYFQTSWLNTNGATYVAYLFAHNAGGFGESGEDNVISCGSFTTDGSGLATVDLGYEPQWILVREPATNDNWRIFDTMRGWNLTTADKQLNPNLSDAESDESIGEPTATGFRFQRGASKAHIYIAIRRGPMKVPESGTSVFQPVAYTGTFVDNRLVDTGILTDMTMARVRNETSVGGFYTADRLRANASLGTAITDAENSDGDSFMTPTLGYGNSFSAMNGFGVGNDTVRKLNQPSAPQLAYAFARAPGFFDEVCYTGTGVARTVAHNLGVAPELMIVKERNTAGGWKVYSAPTGEGQYLFLNSDAAPVADASFYTWNNTAPTSSVFSLGIAGDANQSGATYVAYLFASCPGVSKIGTFTYPGTSTVDCGFSSGARFVMLKRTSTSGGWLVFDTARGIVSGNDPYLELQDTNAEVTTGDVIDPSSSGFAIGSNFSNGTYIFLAIA